MRIVQIAFALLANAVPILGLFGLGWSPATTLVVYWCESVTATVFVAVRLGLHSLLTRKRGYYRKFAGPDPEPGGGPLVGWGAYISTYLRGAVVGTLVTAFFYGLLIFGVFTKERGVDRADLEQGMLMALSVLTMSLAADLHGISRRPFLWARRIAEASMSRLILLLFALILGGVFYVAFRRPVAFYVPFMLLKALVDVDAACKRTGGGFLAQASGRFNGSMARRLGAGARENVRRADEQRERQSAREAEAMVQDEWTLGRAPNGRRIWLGGEAENPQAEDEWTTRTTRKSPKSRKTSRKPPAGGSAEG